MAKSSRFNDMSGQACRRTPDHESDRRLSRRSARRIGPSYPESVGFLPLCWPEVNSLLGLHPDRLSEFFWS